jgi:hypothetical protein
MGRDCASGPPAKIGRKEWPERHARGTWRAAIPEFLRSALIHVG